MRSTRASASNSTCMADFTVRIKPPDVVGRCAFGAVQQHLSFRAKVSSHSPVSGDKPEGERLRERGLRVV